MSKTPTLTHALSIREPYAWLIASGFKQAEIRSFPFPKKFAVPTWIAIHASLSREELNDIDLFEDLMEMETLLADIIDDEDTWSVPGNRLYGCSEIIGAMRVNFSIRASDNDDKWADWADLMLDRSDRCTTELDPTIWLDDEMHNWIIDDCVRFEQPIVCLGRLNVWPLGDTLGMLVNQQFKKAMKTGGLERGAPIGKPIIFQQPKKAVRKHVPVA